MFQNSSLYKESIINFEKNFGEKPKFISYAPGRINVIGEHTDYTGGLSIPAAINCWVSASFSHRNDYKVSIYSENYQEAWKFSLDEIKQLEVQKASWKQYVKGAFVLFMEKYGMDHGISLYLQGNVPLGKGVSSSAAFEISLLNALRKTSGKKISDQEIILMAQQIEHNFLDVKSGLLDQFASQFSKSGQFQIVDFSSLENHYITAHKNFNNFYWILIDTMVERKLADSGYQERVQECDEILKLLEEKFGKNSFRETNMSEINLIFPLKEKGEKSNLYQRAKHIISENKRTLEAKSVLESGDFFALGKLLNETHKSLSQDYNVSCKEADFLQKVGTSHQACIGGRMMGGGFGGGVLFLVQKGSESNFITKLLKSYKDYSGIDTDAITFDLVDGAKVCNV